MLRTPPTLAFDIRAPEHISNPYPVYTQLRNEYPVCQLADGFYAISRYEDAYRALQEHDSFKVGIYQEPIFNQQWLKDRYSRSGFLMEVDPPEHDKYLAVFNRRTIQEWQKPLTELIKKTALHLTVQIQADEPCDFVGDFAYPLVTAVLAKLTGLPLTTPHAVAQVREWAELAESFSSPDPEAELKASAERMVAEQTHIFDELFEERRSHPQNDAATRLVQGSIDGRPLSVAELHGAMNLIIIATFTTARQLPLAMLTLARNPQLMKLLNEQPRRWPAFVEELIRYESAGQSVIRITGRPVALHGMEIPMGERVLILIAAANRDPAQFNNPDEFILSRSNIGTHLGFGRGVHQCIGAALARLTLHHGLEILCRKFPAFAIPPEHTLDWYHSTAGARSVHTLPIQFSQNPLP